MKNKLIFTLIIQFFVFTIGFSQFLVNIGIGGTAYQGDISLFSVRASFQGTELAYHAEVGTKLNNYLTTKIGYLSGSFGASDAGSFNGQRAKRNLSFKSEVNELFLSAEIDLIELFYPFRYSGRLRPFFKGGVGVFHFNPKAYYKGNWIELQPLGTEGQGSSMFKDRKKYNRYQISIPFGIGLEFRIHDELKIMAQISPRWTFTDYLDDVSMTYPNYEELLESNGSIAADLSDRSWENGGERGDRNGLGRGNPELNDWFFYAGIDISYNFDMRRVKGIFNRDYRLVSCKFY